MKKNHMNIAIIVFVVIFVVLLIYYLRRKEGYLTDLNVGNWKMNATTDKLSVEGPEDKEVAFGSKISAKSLKAKSLDVTKDNGQGIVVDDNGDLHVYGKIFIHENKTNKPTWFIENRGQKDRDILVISRTNDGGKNGQTEFGATSYLFPGFVAQKNMGDCKCPS